MARKKVTGRFYIFLIMLALGAFFVAREFFSFGTSEGLVTLATASYSNTVDAVVVRNEAVSSFEGNGRVVYVAAEGENVSRGDVLAEVYSSSYSEKEMDKLETVRQNIRAYHQTILDNIVDSSLERLETAVQQKALELKTLVNRKSTGSLINLQSQLEEAMTERQDYLRQNRREDPKLNQLYEEEEKRVSAISAWKSEETASMDGVVSFYLDGYENYLTLDRLDELTSDDVRAVINGQPLSTGEESRLRQNICRVVSEDEWYVLLVSDDASWNPISGQVFTFQIEDIPDVAFTGEVTAMQKSGSDVMAQVKVTGPLGPLLNRRSGRAHIATNLTGYSVPVKAVTTQNGQTGVWVNDVPGGTFVAVEVLSTDARYALIQPLVQGTITLGQKVLLQ